MIKTICHISDTHESHEKLIIPPSDLLIHSGDLTFRGELDKIRCFLDWFEKQPAKYKVFIAGNHDWAFEKDPGVMKAILSMYNVIYLENDRIELEGLKLWGSPVTPWFCDWAFNKARGGEINRYWDMIPEDTDLLITHGPPYGILDNVLGSGSVGCEDLMNRVLHIKPQVHLFGHIHGNYGLAVKNGTLFSNGSSLNEKYQVTNAPRIINLV